MPYGQQNVSFGGSSTPTYSASFQNDATLAVIRIVSDDVSDTSDVTFQDIVDAVNALPGWTYLGGLKIGIVTEQVTIT